jgi:hypothetical protein
MVIMITICRSIADRRAGQRDSGSRRRVDLDQSAGRDPRPIALSL